MDVDNLGEIQSLVEGMLQHLLVRHSRILVQGLGFVCLVFGVCLSSFLFVLCLVFSVLSAFGLFCVFRV